MPTSLFDDTALRELQIAAKEMEHPPYFGPHSPDERINNALALVQNGAVSLDKDGYLVKGRTRSYRVGDACTCEDYTKRKTQWCYHRVAMQLYKHWQLRLGATPMPTTHDPILPLRPSTADEWLAQDATESTQTFMSVTGQEKTADVPQRQGDGKTEAFLPLPMGRMLRPLHAILADLRRPLPEACIPSFQRGGTEVDFLSWHQVTHLLHVYAPGWYPEIMDVQEVAGPVTLRVRLVIVSAEGKTAYEGVGRDNGEEFTGKAFGDKARRAYAHALKHAAQILGMDWLQEQVEKSQALAKLDEHLLEEQKKRIKALGESCESAGVDKQAYIAKLMRQACVTSWKHIPVATLEEATACVEQYAAQRKE